MRKISLMVILSMIAFTAVCFAVDAPLNLRFANNLPEVTNPLPYFNQNFQVPRSVSRTSGVAPLSVHFGAGFKPSSATDRSFHNYEYAWNFGDPSSGNWGTNGNSKNLAKGPVAAHVYETPGTYMATLTIRDASGVVNTDSFMITVTDPDVIFSGTNTTCISDSANNNFTGCPTGATRVSTNDISRVANYIGPGRRVLLHRGSSWSSSGISMPNNSGPVAIGAYGTGNSVDALGIYSNAPHVTLTGGFFCDLSRKQDWRISDLRFSGGNSGGVFGGTTNVRQILMLRLRTQGFGTPIGLSHWKGSASDLIDQIVLSSSDISGATTNCVYLGAERLVVQGCKINNSMESHVVRVWQGYLGIVSDNQIAGSSIQTNHGRQALKFHGPGEEEICPDGIGPCLNKRTEFAVISNNAFGSSGPWPVSIGPADEGQNCRITDIIFERNLISRDYGQQSSLSVNVDKSLSMSARYATIRNNIIDASHAGSGYTGIIVLRRGVEPSPVGTEVYNNTIYRFDSSNTGNGSLGIDIGQECTATIVRNNLVSFPNVTGPKTLLNNMSSDLIQDHNLLTFNAGLIDPDDAVALQRNFGLLSTSVAFRQGIQVPVLDNYSGSYRNSVFNLGAY